MMSAYSKPFEEVRDTLPKIYLDLFRLELKLVNTVNFNVIVQYGATSLAPTVYLLQPIGSQIEKIVITDCFKVSRKDLPRELHVGYKHYDSWKNLDSTYMDSSTTKLNRRIKRKINGFIKYWAYRTLGKI